MRPQNQSQEQKKLTANKQKHLPVKQRIHIQRAGEQESGLGQPPPSASNTLLSRQQTVLPRPAPTTLPRLGITPQPSTSTISRLTVNEPNDRYEQEAEAMAKQVVNTLHTTPTNTPQTHSSSLQRVTIQRAAQDTVSGKPVQADVEATIHQAKGGGTPLVKNLHTPMEQAFGADFSGVRIHTDARANQLNEVLQAKAFTTGQDIFFRQGAYEPGSRNGRELIAHELTHVVQQRGGVVQPKRIIQRATITVASESHTVNDEESARDFHQRFQLNSDVLEEMAQALEKESRHDLAGIVRGQPQAPSSQSFSLFGDPSGIWGPLVPSERSQSRFAFAQGPSAETSSSQELPASLFSRSQSRFAFAQGPSEEDSSSQEQEPSFSLFSGFGGSSAPQEQRGLPVPDEPAPPVLSAAYQDVYEQLRHGRFLDDMDEEAFAALEPPEIFALEKMLEGLNRQDYTLVDDYKDEVTTPALNTAKVRIQQRVDSLKQVESELGQTVMNSMTNLNQPGTGTTGVHYPESYRQQFPARWDDAYRSGHTQTPLFRKIGYMDWLVEPRVSASDALDAWFQGLTIAECFTSIVAIQYKALRDKVGKDKFDTYFGGQNNDQADEARLRICPSLYDTPLWRYYMKFGKDAQEGEAGNRPNIAPGTWVYFYNHPQYLLKHPGGAVQGENAIYMGNDKFQGFGMAEKTEDEVLDWLVNIYNGARDYADYRVILLHYVTVDLDKIPGIYQGYLSEGELNKLSFREAKELYNNLKRHVTPLYREEEGEFPNRITKRELVEAPEYEIGGVTRKGGLIKETKSLDAAKVDALDNR